MSFTTDSIPRSAIPLALGYRRLSDGLAGLARGRQGFAAGRGERAGALLPRPAESPATSAPPPPTSPETLDSHPDLEVSFDADSGVLWQWQRPRRRPSFTFDLLEAMRSTRAGIDRIVARDPDAISYVVTGSRVPGVFNLGGDLPHFADLIRRGARDELRSYAHACIDVKFGPDTPMVAPYVSISLVQGDALGGGFERALADDVIVAEKGAKFGLPEVLFGLFPGMGAYSYLSRKLGGQQAENMILSGRIYSAEELHDMGLVAMLAEPGEGRHAVAEFIKREQRTFKARTALAKIRQRTNPLTREELIDITDTWVDTALTLGPGELRKMERLAAAQNRRWQQIANADAAAIDNGIASAGA
jgi:DSF synthase